jgi:hypothetical protein
MTLTDLCEELNNYFEQLRIYGEFAIIDGSIDLSDYNVHEGQYIRIVGSVFNDGVHRYPIPPNELLVDETFNGSVWAMAVPSSVIAQMEEINQWLEENQSALNSPYQSESFGGYSYTRKSGDEGDSANWQSHFHKTLDRWRKLRAY